MKIINSLLVIILSVSGIVANNSYLENFNPDSLRYKISYATRCIDKPSIDGRLEDEACDLIVFASTKVATTNKYIINE